jgi:hypothetical protein
MAPRLRGNETRHVGKHFRQHFLILRAFLFFLTNYSKNRFSARGLFLFCVYDRFMPFGPVRFSWHEALLKKNEGDAVSEVFFDVEKDIVHVESTRHHRNVGNLSVPSRRAAKTPSQQ